MKHVFVNFCLLRRHKCQCSVFRSHQVTILHFPLISKVSSSHLWTQHLANYQIYILMLGHTGIFISPHTFIFSHYSLAPSMFLLRLIKSWKLFNDCSPVHREGWGRCYNNEGWHGIKKRGRTAENNAAIHVVFLSTISYVSLNLFNSLR